MALTTAEAVKQLRELTGLGMMECKALLQEAGNDFEKARELAAKRGQDRAEKLKAKAATEGIVAVYIHTNHRVGALVELNCNTDFVARGDEFQALAREIAMHVVAMNPQVVRREELDQAKVDSIREYRKAEEMKTAGKKPEQVIDKIVEGKMRTWFEERVLLDQPWVKEPSKTIRQLIEEKIATIKENIEVARFARFEVGQANRPAEDESGSDGAADGAADPS